MLWFRWIWNDFAAVHSTSSHTQWTQFRIAPTTMKLIWILWHLMRNATCPVTRHDIHPIAILVYSNAFGLYWHRIVCIHWNSTWENCVSSGIRNNRSRWSQTDTWSLSMNDRPPNFNHAISDPNMSNGAKLNTNILPNSVASIPTNWKISAIFVIVAVEEEICRRMYYM